MTDREDVRRITYGSNFVRQGGVMFLAVAVFNLFSLLYQLYMVRNLSPVDYGVLNAIFSLLTVATIPSGTLQTVVTKFISTYYAQNHYHKIVALLRSFVVKTTLFSLALCLILAAGSRLISSFMQISSPLLIILLGIVTFFSIVLPLVQGGLQGLQQFGYLGLTMVVSGGLKLALGVFFICIGWGVTGAVGSLAVSTALSLLLAGFWLSVSLRTPRPPASELTETEKSSDDPEMNYLEIYRYFYVVAAVLLCYTILTNIDVVLVKHYFEPVQAGYYSIAQMAGKVILFLPVAITLVMFPHSAKLHTESKGTFGLLLRSLFCVGTLCTSAALVCFLFPEFVIGLLSGQPHAEAVSLVRIFSVTMVFSAMVYTLLYYHLSIHSTGFIWPLVFLTVAQTLLIILFHRSLAQVLYIMCGNAILLFVINFYLAYKQKDIYGTTGLRCHS
jgi:O-antigen/teichoic acid export membrane protein